MSEAAVCKADRPDAIDRAGGQDTHGRLADPASSVTHHPRSDSPATALSTRLTDRERLYIAAMESSGFAFYTRDADNVIVAWNPGAQRLFGYGAEEAIGRDATLLVPDDRADDLRLIGDKLRREERIDHFATVRLRKDGRRVDVLLTISPIKDEAGTLVGQFVLALDVTEQKLAEEKLRLAVELCPNGMVMIDASGAIVMVNAETEKLFGYERAELIGRPVDVLVPLRFRGAHPRHRHTFAADPRPRAMGAGRDLYGLRKDGTEFPVEVGLNPIHTRDGMAVLSVIIDISKRKRNERLKDEFVATVSHELRTPLTSIAGSLGLLVASAAGKLPDNVTRLLTIAHNNSQRLVRLINDILDIEKMETGNVVFDLRPLEIRALVEQAIDANRGFAEGYGVRVRLDPDAAVGEVHADGDRLVQVITNLLSNAIKFSPRGEDVTVRIDNRDSVVRISVRDRGPGIPEEFKPRIFDKFAQADGSDARRKGGTGLGLSIVKQIVTRLGGEVGFADAYGGGTLFHVELPWFRRASEQIAHAAAAIPRLLLCEDDRETAAGLCQRLRPAGFATDVAATAEEAEKCAAAISYAGILVDLRLPDGDGISLIKNLRAQPRYHNTPIIVMSADIDSGRTDVRSSGLDILDWFDKPVDVDRLVQVLDRPSVRNGRARPRVLHVDDDANVLGAVAQALAGSADVVSAGSVEQARDALATDHFDFAVLDVALAAGSGLDLLPDLVDRHGNAIPVIVMSARGANPRCAAQVHAALAKSRASIEGLVEILRKRVTNGDSDALIEKEVA